MRCRPAGSIGNSRLYAGDRRPDTSATSQNLYQLLPQSLVPREPLISYKIKRPHLPRSVRPRSSAAWSGTALSMPRSGSTGSVALSASALGYRRARLIASGQPTIPCWRASWVSPRTPWSPCCLGSER